MNLKAVIFIILGFFLRSVCSAQDYFSYGSSNFAGLSSVIANPATAADNHLMIDATLGGYDFNFNNSWFSIKREALKYSGSLFHPSSITLPDTWKNKTPNVPDNVFKNFNDLSSTATHAILIENRIIMPSFLYQIDAKSAIAFNWSVRQMGNISGISQQLGFLFEKELDLNVTQNNPIQNKNLSAVQMSWAEYGFTYACVIRDKDQHFVKVGITPKILVGVQAAYLNVEELGFLFSNKDTSSYLNSNFAYAHSASYQVPQKNPLPLSDIMQGITKPSLGIDLGVVYEWRPKYESFKTKSKENKSSWNKNQNKYKLKLGASLLDIGKIKFNKEGTYYDLNVSVHQNDVTKFTTLPNFNSLDSMLRADYSNKNQSSQFSILLPTSFNTQADYAINNYFYLNLSTHFANFYQSNLYRVHNYTAICFAPRFEHYWFDASLPFTYNTLNAQRFNYLTAGLNIRIGPLSLGTSNLKPIFKGDISSYNFYAILKCSIPYPKLKDRDGDGVKDLADACPDIAGDPELNGCPDKDHDKVPDYIDACPNQVGLPALKGCPDTDGDGISDANDVCPTEKGLAYLKGCPDNDKDSIANKEDACADLKGPKQFKGCPDTDKDGIPDKDDLCPTVKGLAKYKGCNDRDNDLTHDGIDNCPDLAGPLENKGCPWPDTDKDGIIDKQDSCINIAGVKAYKGCPEPVKLAAVEKRILEKAFSTLEFESGQDIIKKNSYPALNALTALLLKHKNDWQIKLSGHTDNEGDEVSNLLLSEKRAKAVQTYLVKKGLMAETILVEWFGQNRPIADNARVEGRRKNRRVEMLMLVRIKD